MRFDLDEGRSICVTGRARISAPADLTVVSMRISGVRRTYDQAMADMVEGTGLLKDAIEKAGLDRDILKTDDLKVTQHQKRVKTGEDANGHDKYDYVFDGFEFETSMSFEFPNDNRKLSDAISYIMDLDITPRIDFGFRCSDPEGMRRRAIAKATSNALADAKAIVEAAGSRLGPLLRAEYGAPHPVYPEHDDYADTMGSAILSAPQMDINPGDDETVATVELVWGIADRPS